MKAPWTWSREVRMASDAGATSAAIEPLLAQLQTDAWDEGEVFGVHLAVEEALVNAIKHGNCEDPAKQVLVEYRANSDCVQIEITDQGAGFDPAAVPDPLAEENLEIPHGRGLLLMRHYMSRVEFRGRGNCVLLEKCRLA